jgi:hypothetical protein
MPGFGCANATIWARCWHGRACGFGRPAGLADATVNAAAIARYREGKVRALDTSGTTGGTSGGSGGGIGGGAATSATN